ncbi:conserved hypothetical protein [Talaromyces stipitatus ATCC 10500]|uniref:Uncharacterized protein n=1 Tax=Talaromyces stipitatus (strain ATCC 10500 / CBS 375.48 / QM 6759 / NRRL 1006) TaxID=441959 RepID=B8M6X4_TALSN|nr:uncharacterized protein TSTA_034330 [Talaromyces stipitatus ATCC 10500]EED20194.1 conserved hypothetical protein [Talaromyces stipitatus ATCC 10500]
MTTTTPAAPSSTTPKTTLSTLTFEKNSNTKFLHIPSNIKNKKYRIEKRPIPRTPVASPYAGARVPKIVYVGTKTPFMSAVKRVEKLLRLAERRAMGPVIGSRRSYNNNQTAGRGKGGEVLEKCQRRLGEDKVLVKATGRAIERALSVGRWFEEGKGGGGGIEYEVVVRTGSVCVVDDIVEEELQDDEKKEEEKDVSMTNTDENPEMSSEEKREGKEESKHQRRRRRRRERIREQRLKAFRDEDGETPESRTRWVNMVEIAISMKKSVAIPQYFVFVLICIERRIHIMQEEYMK